MNTEDVQKRVTELGEQFATQRAERQERTSLDPADFEALAGAGYLHLAVPVDHGGLFEGVQKSTRPICETLRNLAHGDPSVALVSAMHPAVLVVWAEIEEADPKHAEAWRAQREKYFRSALEGHWWGTITSEPGSGGDVFKTNTVARKGEDGRTWTLSGDKHFGSGSGISSFMITTARAEGSKVPGLFVFDMRDVPWDGSTGARLIAQWDGHGMSATQSHAFRFDDFPAERYAWPRGLERAMSAAGQLGDCVFTAVVLGVVESAVAAARENLRGKKDSLRSFEQVEWTRTLKEAWLCEQAYQGMLRAVESGERPSWGTSCGKASVAELAETLMLRVSKVVGGGTFSRRSPFGRWAQDVRALGFLRPPWGLAFDKLFEMSWED